MRKFSIITTLFLLFACFGHAALLNTEWKKVENPSVDVFLTGLKNKEFLTLIKNHSDENMNFQGESETRIAHMITLLRRVTLESFGIKNWNLSSVKKTTYLKYQVIKLQGSYTNQDGVPVSFFENMYFYDHRFVQLSWFQPNPTSAPAEAHVESLFKNMELDYL